MTKKNLLRQSLASETKAVKNRFDQAQEIMESRPRGLAGPEIRNPSAEKNENLRAEIQRDLPSQDSTKTFAIPVEDALDNPFNARRIYNPEIIKNLAASLATQGQLIPALATRHPKQTGQFILIDGQYRKRALMSAGKKTIEVTICEIASELDLYRLSYQVNEERQSQSVLDNALAWQHLISEGKVSGGDEIATLTGLSTAAVTKTMSVLKLPESAIGKVREHSHKFGVAITYEIFRCAKHLNEPALLALMDRIVNEDLSSRDIDQLRTRLEEGRERKKKDISRQYRIKDGSKQIGVIKDWDSGKVALEVTIADPKLRAALIDDLKKRFLIPDKE